MERGSNPMTEAAFWEEEYYVDHEDYRTENVRVKCHVCQNEHDNELEFGTSKKYPEDFFIKCKECGATEEGSLPVRSFDVLDNVSHGTLS